MSARSVLFIDHSLRLLSPSAYQLQIPMAEIQVTWTEIPGSKLRVTSTISMALELLLIKASGRVKGELGVHVCSDQVLLSD